MPEFVIRVHLSQLATASNSIAHNVNSQNLGRHRAE